MKSQVTFILSLIILLFSACQRDATQPDRINVRQWEGVYHGSFSIEGRHCDHYGTVIETYKEDGEDWIKVSIDKDENRVIFKSGESLGFQFENIFLEQEKGDDCTLGKKYFRYNDSFDFYYNHSGEFAIEPRKDELHII